MSVQLYGSVFINCYSRKCVGFTIRIHLRDSLDIDSLEAAIHQEKPNNRLISIRIKDASTQATAFMTVDAVSLHTQSIP